VPEEAFHAKPVFVAEEAPLAMPLVPPRAGRKGRKSKADAKSGGVTAGLLDLAILVALAPALLVAAGALGVKFGLFPLAVGYDQMTLDWAPKAALLSVATGVLGLIAALFGGFSRYWKKALLALGITIATLGAMVAANALGGRAPPIHDVSTDWKTPLMLSDAGLAARGGDQAQTVEADPSLPVGSLAYAGRRIADVNAETCPAARPLVLARSPADAYESAKAAVQAAGLSIVTDDPMDGRLEATGQSFWYGLKDDLSCGCGPTRPAPGSTCARSAARPAPTWAATAAEGVAKWEGDVPAATWAANCASDIFLYGRVSRGGYPLPASCG
jgi:fatty-acyl-CoA synthase